MPAASRLGDLSAGHGCWPPTVCVDTKTSRTFVNGILLQKLSSVFATHCCGDTCHSGRATNVGSSTVFIEGQPAIRISDGIDCGDAVGQGSPNVFIGG